MIIAVICTTEVAVKLQCEKNSQCDQLPEFGLIAQLAEYYTRIAEVMGSNPVQV